MSEDTSFVELVRRIRAGLAELFELPDNEPSLALVRRLGFEHTGQHWDEEDGEELEFELRITDGA